MQLSRGTLPAFVVCGLLSLSQAAHAGNKKVFVDSTPEGAQVELNGNITCTTPCTINFPSAFFGEKHTAFGKYLDEPIVIRLSKEGFVPKDAHLVTGPHHWSSLNGQNHFDYYYFSNDHFNVSLTPVQTFVEQGAPVAATEELPIEQIVHDSLPAIVQIHAGQFSGSGFFITSAGLVATNAHVVEGQPSVTVITPDGKPLSSNSIYVDHDRDLALIKVDAHDVPFLALSSALPMQGAEVIAIGTPGINDVVGVGLLPNSVSKGIVSGIRTFSEDTIANAPGRAGTWIQMDTTINHGNSGGPLINRAGLVVGINTLGFAGTGTPGINFALSAKELAGIVHERLGITLGPKADSTRHSDQAAAGKISILSTPDGADIEIDGVFLGNTPSDLSVETGKRVIRITKKGYQPYERTLQVQPNGSQRISAELDPVAAP
jgi:S1-C subfamily serine protease